MRRSYLRRRGIEAPADDDVVERVVRRAGTFDASELATWLETGEIDESRLPEHRLAVGLLPLP